VQLFCVRKEKKARLAPRHVSIRTSIYIPG
jgi:hypothetical protein